MILRRSHRQGVDPIGQDEKAGLFARHEVFDHHFGTGRAKFAVEHVVNGGKRLGQCQRHDDAFASGKPVGLDHDGRALVCDIGAGRGRFSKPGIGGCRGVASVADFLGEGFGRLQPGCRSRGSEGQNPGRPRCIGDTGGQGGFWPDDDEINGIFDSKADHGSTVQYVKVGAFGKGCDARVAGGHDQSVAFGVLLDRPSQRMFPTAASKDKDVHRLTPLGVSLRAS